MTEAHDVAPGDAAGRESQRTEDDLRLARLYPSLTKFCAPIVAPQREIVGRDREVMTVLSSLARPELSNVVLLGPAGSGKTALVQAVMLHDKKRSYLEVDLTRMIADSDGAQMAADLKIMFDEAEQYAKNEANELVLFIDEFHQIVQLSPPSVEALKPVLAASGARGIRVIAATTYDEYNQWVRPNQPLVERLQRVNLTPPDEATTVQILRGMAERYGVSDKFPKDNALLHLIYEYTERYNPSATQPRKSILILDAMVGQYNYSMDIGNPRPMNLEMLNQVLEDTLGIDVAFKVDAGKIKERLDSVVLSQKFATQIISKRLQVVVADLHDKTRPLSNLLFTGPSATGKSTTDDTLVPVYDPGGKVFWKRAGDLEVGDQVFKRNGEPQKVLGVFPQGEREIFRVTLTDGRTLDVSDNHLWAVYPNRRSRADGPTIYSTQTLLNKGLTTTVKGGGEAPKYVIDMNGPVQWPEADLALDPYALGALIGNGLLTQTSLEFSSMDEETVVRVGEAAGAARWRKSENNYTWVFYTDEVWGSTNRRVALADVLSQVPELIGVYSGDRRIPKRYLHASIAQRWALVQGLFDTDGHIGQSDGERYSVSYSTTSEGLAGDVRSLLLSLGVGANVSCTRRERDGRELVEYCVNVKTRNDDKTRFFALTRKREIAQRAIGVARQRQRTYDYVGIRSIEPLGKQAPMTCIYVEGDEHLYIAGHEFVVTHNTEMTKQLARLIFGDDQRRLVRFDMSEFALDTSMDLFRSELTARVWSLGHCVVLLDEIEKAASTVTRMLLQVLDDGRLSDDNGRQVSFLNCYFVLTTNAANEIYKTIAQYSPDDDGSGVEMLKRMKEIRSSISSTSANNKFPPELLGRIDAIVPFQPLTLETQRKIILGKMNALRNEVMRKHGVELTIDERVMTYIVDDRADTDSDAGGARAAVNILNDQLVSAVAAFVNQHPDVKRVAITVRGMLRTENKNKLESNAEIVVAANQSRF